ncbi:ATP-dependent DNA helicase RecQ [bacterium]|nr:ATP-dependent DNA helicase RecQ [bacterium]
MDRSPHHTAQTSAPHSGAAHAALERHFGFRAFLDGQQEAVQAVLDGHDTLIVMPTGGGKSLCYQLPAMMLDGITIVVSPLIALMKDQVDGLAAKGLPATFINSSLPEGETERRIAGMTRGEYRLVYIAPERFKSTRFIHALAPLSIALFAIDEAHCISQWGHDFRPDYLRLKRVLPELGRPQVAALTATATPDVRADIIAQLGLGSDGRREPRVLVSGFARHNLTFVVSRVKDGADKLERILKAATSLGTGIVYCATRKNVERVAADLALHGCRPVAYHAGMSDEERSKAQDAFMGRSAPIVVATNAFGMGVDRADVRFVVHYDIPGSVEAYYQEAGRAGRDGEPAWCELMYNYADVRTQEFFIEGSNPARDLLEDVYDTVRRLCADGPVEVPITGIAAAVGAKVNGMAVGTALNQLERAGALQREYVGGSRTYTTQLVLPVVPFDDLPIDYKYLDAKRERDERKLEQVIAYAEYRRCRHQYILAYFGDSEAASFCGVCDHCIEKGRGAVRAPNDDELLAVRKTLSGVARLDGRFGRGRISQMLAGSHAREVIDAGLDKLPTYGALADEGAEYVWALIDALIDAGCIAAAPGEYPTLSLTPLGREVMHNRAAITLALPRRGAAKRAAPAKHRKGRAPLLVDAEGGDARINQPLLDALRAWRSRTAAKHGIPPYLIYPDKTLRELATHAPRTNIALLAINGIGPAKARQYGIETLGIIAAHAKD